MSVDILQTIFLSWFLGLAYGLALLAFLGSIKREEGQKDDIR